MLSENKEYNIEASAELRTPSDTPEIYTLIQDKASTDKITQQLYKDFYDPEQDPEKLFLGIEELLERENEGLAALHYLAKGTDELSLLMKKIVDTTEISQNDLENILGMKRWGQIIDIHSKNYYEEIYTIGVQRGLIKNMNYNQFISLLYTEQLTYERHLTGDIEKDLTTTGATFGVFEPSYLELLGPKEILRIRNKEQPIFLLLGSLGKTSAHDFKDFAKKVNSNTTPFVIDISSDSIKELKKDNTTKTIVQADARALPLATESVDYAYTNHLFHFIEGKSHTDIKQSIDQIFNEAYRVLTSGGSFIIQERYYGQLEQLEDKERFEREVSNAALKAGFKLQKELHNAYNYAFRAEVNKAVISPNGFGHYDNTTVDADMQTNFALKRYTK